METKKFLVIRHHDNDGMLGGALCDLHANLNKPAEIDTITLNHVKNDLEEIKRVVCTRNCKYDRIYIVDYSFNLEEALGIFKFLFDHSVEVIWFDHHDSSFDFIKGNPTFIDENENRLFGMINKSACGAYLAYIGLFISPCNKVQSKLQVDGTTNIIEQYDDYHIPYILKLVDDYDTWKHLLPNKVARYFNRGTFGLNRELLTEESGYKLWNEWLNDDILSNALNLNILNPEHTCIDINDVIDDGRIDSLPKEKEYISKLNEYGFIGKLDGHTCLCLNEGLGNSFAFEELIDKFDFCILFTFNGEKYKYTLYSKEVSVVEICMKHGGGGHKNAAGFTSSNMEIEFVKSLSNYIKEVNKNE
jgi:hypothetical protein